MREHTAHAAPLPALYMFGAPLQDLSPPACQGVTIGDDCVISAGTVVSQDEPAGHIPSGTRPAREPLPEHLRQG